MPEMIWRRKTVVSAATVLPAVLLLAACGGTTRDDTEEENTSAVADEADPNAEIPADLAFSFVPKQINNPYMTYANSGGETAAEELDGTFEEVGPSEATADSQVSYINTVSQQGADVMVIAANDPEAVCPAITEAQSQGTIVVAYDSDTNCRDLFVNQSSGEMIAETLVEQTAEQIDGEGQIAFLSATPNATNQNAWIEEMEGLLDTEEYSGIEAVDTVYGNDDDQDSFEEMQGLLQSHSDLDAVVSPTTVGMAAAARYLSDSEYQGEVALTGLGLPNQMSEYLDDGTVEEFALWDPADMAYLAGYAGGALAAGQITAEEGQTFAAGDLGEYEIEADGEVVLGPPTVFTEDNVDDYDF